MFVVQPPDFGDQLFDSLDIYVSNRTQSPCFPIFRVPCIIELNVSNERKMHLSQEPKLIVIHKQLLQITKLGAVFGCVDGDVREITLETPVIQHGVDYLLHVLSVRITCNPDQLPNPRPANTFE